MKKKENLWNLIKRMDEEAGATNPHFHLANHFFDKAAERGQQLIERHRRDFQSIRQKFTKKSSGKKPK